MKNNNKYAKREKEKAEERIARLMATIGNDHVIPTEQEYQEAKKSVVDRSVSEKEMDSIVALSPEDLRKEITEGLEKVEKLIRDNKDANPTQEY